LQLRWSCSGERGEHSKGTNRLNLLKIFFFFFFFFNWFHTRKIYWLTYVPNLPVHSKCNQHSFVTRIAKDTLSSFCRDEHIFMPENIYLIKINDYYLFQSVSALSCSWKQIGLIVLSCNFGKSKFSLCYFKITPLLIELNFKLSCFLLGICDADLIRKKNPIVED
jgi:hypothetical protein